jgi:hypothetical protein
MYDTLTNAEFLALYSQALQDRTAGAKITKWTAGDTTVEKAFTLNWSNPNAWAELAAEFRLRFPEKVRAGRPRYTRSVARFADC